MNVEMERKQVAPYDDDGRSWGEVLGTNRDDYLPIISIMLTYPYDYLRKGKRSIRFALKEYEPLEGWIDE